MKAITIFNFGVAFMLTIVSNGVRAELNTHVLDEMAKKGTKIKGIFKPSVNGSLGFGYHGFAYKGHFIPRNNIEVAMKFTPLEKIEIARGEFEFYTYLNAIDNPDVVNNGIPAIYYFGEWNNHTILAMTLLAPKFGIKVRAGWIREVDVLIAFRGFVRTIKYIHSKGIIHGDIHLNNLIIQNGQCFIFDFGNSSDMNQYTREGNIRSAKIDFEKFVDAMFELVQPRTNWHWLGLSQNQDTKFRMDNPRNFMDKLFEDAGTNGANNFRGLRRIFVEFAKNANDNTSAGTRIPLYDQLYQVIYEECENYGGKARTTISSISSIPDPFGVNIYPRPKVNYQFFENM